jgi:DNA-binding NarL/FixJ family response regulator
MDRKYKILVFETMPLFNAGIRLFLEKEEFEVTGIPCDWEELNNFMKNVTPDVILVDLVQCAGSCLHQLNALKNKFPEIPVLLITNENFTDYNINYIMAGVDGIVYSNEMPAVLSEALHQVVKGREFFPEKLFSVIKNAPRSAQKSGGSLLSDTSPLSSREISVLRLFCEGLSYKEIGNSLGISARTVETHKQHILAKLQIKSTAEMVRCAIEHHLI